MTLLQANFFAVLLETTPPSSIVLHRLTQHGLLVLTHCRIGKIPHRDEEERYLREVNWVTEVMSGLTKR